MATLRTAEFDKFTLEMDESEVSCLSALFTNLFDDVNCGCGQSEFDGLSRMFRQASETNPHSTKEYANILTNVQGALYALSQNKEIIRDMFYLLDDIYTKHID